MPTTGTERKVHAMRRIVTVGGLATAVLACGLSVGFAPAAQAAEECSAANANVAPCAPPEGPPFTCDINGICGQLWCPGSGMSGIPDWDMTVCHTFYFDPNAPLTEPVIIAGQPPGPVATPSPCIPFINCLPGLTHA